MKKRKILSTVMTVAMGLSTLTYGALTPAQQADADEALDQVFKSYQEAPIDLGIANDERLIEMLKKEGKIAKDARPAEAEKELQTFLQKKAENAGKTKDILPEGMEKGLKNKGKETNTDSLKNGKGNKVGQAKKGKVPGIEEETYNGEVREDKVLVLAIDFSDYEKSSITPEETDMFYENYTHEHFQNMIFGENGYKGPNGESLVSMKQYYEQQSGGSYTVEGEVAGWYTADHPAAYYGGNYPDENGSDARPRTLVYEALTKAGQDPNVDLSEYDVWDRDDYDGDGKYDEPDGIIDHLMVIHAGVGEEAGGGSLGGDAIWSHRWNLGQLIAVPGGSSDSDRFGGLLGAYDYTIEPEDGAAGVFIHEYGHDLGLPDEYDTVYSGAGEAVAYWSVMASGSWAGNIGGTEPPGFSAYAKEMLQANHGGNWLSGSTIHTNEITSKGTEILLDEGVTKGVNNDAVRVNLPDKLNVMNEPAGGEFEFYSGKGNEIDHKMFTTVDLTGATTAMLDFDLWYDIEQDWDFGMVQISMDGGDNWASLGSDRTTEEIHPQGYPAIKENLPGYTGNSNGWIHETIDLSAYTGQEIQLQFRYMTDWAMNMSGLYVDNVKVTSGEEEVLFDGAESESEFEFDGFSKNDGTFTTDHYYLLEWRSHNGVDEGLSHIRRGASLMSYDPGLVVWYVDESYDNNWTGVHPGDGFLGVVDADQHTNYWSDGAVGSTRYQLHDAAFSFEKSEKMFLDYTDLFGVTLKDNFTKRTALFDDSADFSNQGLVDAGRNVPEYGLKFRVTGQSDDGTVGKVLIFK